MNRKIYLSSKGPLEKNTKNKQINKALCSHAECNKPEQINSRKNALGSADLHQGTTLAIESLPSEMLGLMGVLQERSWGYENRFLHLGNINVHSKFNGNPAITF